MQTTAPSHLEEVYKEWLPSRTTYYLLLQPQLTRSSHPGDRRVESRAAGLFLKELEEPKKPLGSEMPSGFHVALLLCLTIGQWTDANAKCLKTGDCCCPPGWTLAGSRCFMFHFTERDWSDAENTCLTHGGNLASLKTPGDYTSIREIVKRVTGSDKPLWIGGFDAVKEGVWSWSDGSRFNFTRWHNGEPNNAGGEHCMMMNFRGHDYVNDMKCAEKRSFICAREP